MTEFAANFTAIDFETANHRRDSACQLAAVKVREGKIVDSASWMIRPQPFFFTPGNIRIHGITPAQVEHEPNFGDLWAEIAQSIGDDCLVAHNASFDMGVLLACLKKHRQAVPALQFTCTRAIARSTWPNRRRYGLKALADWLGIRFRHHDALEDSIACAKIMLAAGIDKQAGSLTELEQRLRLARGTADGDGYRGPRRRVRSRGDRPAAPAQRGSPAPQLAWPRDPLSPVQESSAPYTVSATAESGVASLIDLQRLLVRADFIRPLAGKSVVFVGKLNKITNEHAQLLASRGGGSCQAAVNQETSLLVIGKAEVPSHVDEQQRRAEALRQSGHAIRILSEDDFLGLVTTQ